MKTKKRDEGWRDSAGAGTKRENSTLHVLSALYYISAVIYWYNVIGAGPLSRLSCPRDNRAY